MKASNMTRWAAVIAVLVAWAALLALPVMADSGITW